MNTGSINPYRPPPPAPANQAAPSDRAVRFYTTESNHRFAESHFVLRLHPLRLIVVSLLLIAASSVVMVGSQFFGPIVFAVSSLAAMVVSALVYLASVYRTKLKLRQRWHDHGLRSGVVCSVAATSEELVLNSPAGVFRWPIDATKTYWTRKGVMLAPEPLLCLFVPRRNESAPEVYDRFRQELRRQVTNA